MTSASNSAQTLEASQLRTADKWLFAGIGLCGTYILGFLGLFCLVFAFYLMIRADKAGATVRPWGVTIIGTLCMMDASANFLAWGIDVFWAHSTGVGAVFMTGYGKIFDGAYYVNYNASPLGGTSLTSEKVFELIAVLIINPIGILGAWGFLKMKKWGLLLLKVRSWLWLAFWTGYSINLAVYFDERLGNTMTGVTGWWLYNIIYITPLVALPYLYSLDPRKFRD